ncbi:MBL fold metallo-hydrolase [Almyronema epifaneia]|uniref:MBL fold metallo-hydrolase n=1 Tax=Almyronema epifaneia S1 TaxID=2991925 RepID=A0ABW6IJQ0_9CYAN
MLDPDSISLPDNVNLSGHPVDFSLPSEMQLGSSFVVQFWGVRGSIPTPGASTVRYGGNTACVEVLVGNKRLILDGGTGLSVLGKHLLKQTARVEAHIFFTHTHWDRIQGFPFFVPAFTEGNQFHIYGATAPNGASIKQCLTDQMLQPNFPTPLQRMRSHLNFLNISAGSVISIDDVVIETVSLNRLTSALGYRITWEGRSVVYATDTDHSQEAGNQNLQYLAQQADVLIYDGTYADHNDHNFQKQSLVAPWKSGIEVAKAANVQELIMFHHNPAHDDDSLDCIEMQIRGDFPNARLAREGMILQIA